MTSGYSFTSKGDSRIDDISKSNLKFCTKFLLHALFLSFSKRFKDVLDSGNVHDLVEE